MVAIIAFLVVAVASSSVVLEPSVKELEVNCPALAEEILTDVTFRNRSASNVFITKIVTSCGCTTIESEGRVVPPNDEIAMKVQFKVGMRTGLQRKNVAVQWIDGNGREGITNMSILYKIEDAISLGKKVVVTESGAATQQIVPLEAKENYRIDSAELRLPEGVNGIVHREKDGEYRILLNIGERFSKAANVGIIVGFGAGVGKEYHLPIVPMPRDGN